MTGTAVEIGTATIAVSEVFGPTVQGEGPSLGRRASFVRLGRCNLSCSWCDTPYTWDWKGRNGRAYNPADELTTRLIDELADEVSALGPRLVVVTGGEPLVQASAVTRLSWGLLARGHDVEVETNGTRRPPPRLADRVGWNVSPKLAHAGDSADSRIVPDALRALAAADRSCFKFVCQWSDDLGEVAAVVAAAGIPDDRVWIMPEGTSAPDLAAHSTALADAVIARGWNLTTRLHVLLWGNERGR